MKNKLAFRNVKKSYKDYSVYFITMVIISSLMFVFNSIIFSKDILQIFSMAGVLGAMVGMATIFIIIVITWLINYMILFMIKNKSKEFGIYLLLGMKKKEVVSLFMRENEIIGCFSLLFGIIPGMFLQQIFQTIFFAVLGNSYSLKIEFNILGFLLTISLYLLIYSLSLFKNKRKLKKMTIQELMSFENKNEAINDKFLKFNIFTFIISIIYIIVFDIIILTGKFNLMSIWLYLGLLVVAIFLFYNGISSFIVNYINKEKKMVFKGLNLFLLRQFASKIKTMKFTMSILTILFVFAILGSSIAMMFNDFLDKRLDYQLPFDIIVFSDKVDDKFEKYIDTINQNNKIEDKLSYNIYQNKTSDINNYLRKELNYPKKQNNKIVETEYFDYDTYIKLSDYNHLRKMLGYSQVSLKDNQFIIHSKDTIKNNMINYFKDNNLKVGKTNLKCKNYYTEAFAQRMHNGADYIVVIPDDLSKNMNKYYSCLAVDIKGKANNNLQDKLEKIKNFYNEDGEYIGKITLGFGSDQIISCTDMVLVKTDLLLEIKFVLTSVCFVFIYISLVFITVGMTVLAIQQISDSIKYKYRYNVLKKLGLKDSNIDKIIFKQLFIYYLIPFIISIIIIFLLVLYLSDKFIYYTGVNTSTYFYFLVSIALILIIYTIYFIVTYVEYLRNIKIKK